MKSKHIFITTIVFVLAFSVGGVIAHYSLPEKGRLTKEEAQHLVDKKYRVMGYLRNEDVQK